MKKEEKPHIIPPFSSYFTQVGHILFPNILNILVQNFGNRLMTTVCV
jgi:hypothetical protein